MLASRPFAGIDIKLEVVDIVDFSPWDTILGILASPRGLELTSFLKVEGPGDASV